MKLLTVQAWGPEFSAQRLHKSRAVWYGLVISVLGKQRRADSLSLQAIWSRLRGELQARERPCFKNQS